MTVDSLARRYWHALTGGRMSVEPSAAERGREGYSLWQRYWSSLLNIRLPPVTAGERGVVPARPNPLTRPYADGRVIRLPRFDRSALRLAATSETDRMSARWDAGGWRFVLRESGPAQVDLLVETDREVPSTRVLPIGVAGPTGQRDYVMVFVADLSGRSVGVLRLPDVYGWIDVTVAAEQSVDALDTGDPAVRASVAESVRATPDPGIPAWTEIVASRPPDDHLRRVITDAAR